MNISIHKFGGASVKNAEAVRNIANILQSQTDPNPCIIVTSAMGKTTNKLEKVVSWPNENKARLELEKIAAYHISVANSLELGHEFSEEMWSLFTLQNHLLDPDARYDATVALGELASTRILSEFLKLKGYDACWWDVRQTIKTDSRHRAARVDEEKMIENGKNLISLFPQNKIIITQGFIGEGPNGETTTLGREGSDYSAALLACASEASEVNIWKDVQGMHNADPRIFEDTITIEKLDYHEALELSYYGASVIHPRTVKPLQNRKIPLYVKSFINPEGPSTCIGDFPELQIETPMYIIRPDITLMSLGPADHSFVGEDHLETVFGALAKSCIHVRMMQNSAVQFSIVFDTDDEKQKKLEDALGSGFLTSSKKGLDLLTVRHGSKDLIDGLTSGREVIMEQVNHPTVRRLLSPS